MATTFTVNKTDINMKGRHVKRRFDSKELARIV